MAVNLASKYSPQVDERFYKASQTAIALNNQYKFNGVKTVNVYSIPTVVMRDYARSGLARYGTPTDLQNNIQALTVTKVRAFSFIIDRGDKTQSEMVMDAGRALTRQIREVVVPEIDTYVLDKIARAAFGAGHTSATAATKNNAYELFLKGQESLGNQNVPDSGRVCFCSYAFANFLKQDPAFMMESQRSKEMIDKGVLGEVDGAKIVKVASSRLPTGCSFILTHPEAACAPKQLEDYKIHDNPPGISGWLVEGRVIYDCFVLSQKLGATYYHGTAFSA